MMLARAPQTYLQSFFARAFAVRELTLLILILVLVVGMSGVSPYFMTLENFRAMAVGLVPTGIIVVGMTLLLVAGGFDLSVGSVLALASTICALLLIAGIPVWLTICLTIIIGGLIGLLNGVLITALTINPLVATLGTMSAARGLALVFTEGFSLSTLPPSFGLAGKTLLLGLPIIVWVMCLVVLLGDIAMRQMTFFRQLYFIGSNERAAKLSQALLSIALALLLIRLPQH